MFTVLGASGFIGSNLVRWLQAQHVSYSAPPRGESLLNKALGHVIYCIGLTADFRERPFDTVRAHVCDLVEVLEHAEFESLLYLSTTRVYGGSKSTGEESFLQVKPGRPNDLYNISKIMGESSCLSSGRPGVRVARLANVYGRDFSSKNFLASVLRDAVVKNELLLGTSMASEKDYVNIEDVVSLLPKISLSGRNQIYNIASGVNTSNADLLKKIREVTGCTIDVVDDAPTIVFPRISIDRVREEFHFQPTLLLDSLNVLISDYRQALKK